MTKQKRIPSKPTKIKWDPIVIKLIQDKKQIFD